MLWNISPGWTLFLDRDGVINERIFGGYITEVQHFKFLPEVLDSFPELNSIFSRVLVVTNQQGIGKGLMSERNLTEIHNYMSTEVEKSGGVIDRIFYASEIKGQDNGRRKPGVGMALDAKKQFPEIDFFQSVMVGDTDNDILFGKKLGMKTVRIKTDEPIALEADLTVNNLSELVIKLRNEIV